MAHKHTERILSLIGWIILGLIAGAIAKAVHKGDEPGGRFGTLLVGALLGGLIASAVGVGGIGSFFSLATWLVAIGGAFLLLVLFEALVGRGAGAAGRLRAAR